MHDIRDNYCISARNVVSLHRHSEENSTMTLAASLGIISCMRRGEKGNR
nr:hypothetical protein [uncultured Prevotella sp.]